MPNIQEQLDAAIETAHGIAVEILELEFRAYAARQALPAQSVEESLKSVTLTPVERLWLINHARRYRSVVDQLRAVRNTVIGVTDND